MYCEEKTLLLKLTKIEDGLRMALVIPFENILLFEECSYEDTPTKISLKGGELRYVVESVDEIYEQISEEI